MLIFNSEMSAIKGYFSLEMMNIGSKALRNVSGEQKYNRFDKMKDNTQINAKKTIS